MGCPTLNQPEFYSILFLVFHNRRKRPTRSAEKNKLARARLAEARLDALLLGRAVGRRDAGALAVLVRLALALMDLHVTFYGPKKLEGGGPPMGPRNRGGRRRNRAPLTATKGFGDLEDPGAACIFQVWP